MARPIVLVTGATGYIAMHIVQQLLHGGGYRVRGTVRSLKNNAKVDVLKALSPTGDSHLQLVEADLLEGSQVWERVVHGCTFVIHTASPFPIDEPKDETEIITPAVAGTINVLQACSVADGIQRVVLTSSVVAVSGTTGADDGSKVFTERDWPHAPDRLPAYAKSKTLAERKAWAFVKALPSERRFELTVINPSYVMGPVLSADVSSGSMVLPKRLLERQMPMIPHLNFPIVDVRDVATAHIRAMTAPQAAGERHLVHAANIWLEDMAKLLGNEFGRHGYKVPSKRAPYCMLWVASCCDGSLRSVVGLVGKQTTLDNTRMRYVLGIEPRDINETLIDMCYSMIDNGLIKKKSKYTGRENTSA